MQRTSQWWDDFFIGMAGYIASASKDPSTRCGAVIVRPDKTVASLGYNGFPKGCSDDDDLYANRELKYARVVHAEVNAILHAREPLEGYSMYTYPGNISPSCDRCATCIIQAGIVRIVHPYVDGPFADRWREPAARAMQMYDEAGVEVVHLEPVFV